MLLSEHEMGSIIAVIATDVPMMPHQLRRLAKRGAIGIARGGTTGGNGSGDIFLALSTANPMPIDRVIKSWLSIRKRPGYQGHWRQYRNSRGALSPVSSKKRIWPDKSEGRLGVRALPKSNCMGKSTGD